MSEQTKTGAAEVAPVCRFCGEPTEPAMMLFDDAVVDSYSCSSCGAEWEPEDLKELEFEFLRAEGVKAIR